MKIILQNIGKRYNAEWIFRNLNYEFSSGNAYVILGANGSGKSTLLQVIAGNFLPSEGNIHYFENPDSKPEIEIESEQIFRCLTIASPYIELPEEFTLKEAIIFHSKFKPMKFQSQQVIELSGLQESQNKSLKYFSSGMKQRVRLTLAILSDIPLLLLDEPASNLDKKGIDWYLKLINDYTKNKLVIICSNQQQYEYSFCNMELTVESYKPVLKFFNA